ncbi:unnamed protein product [Chironomus riparius]|uniref:Uncharacterized protein n=1 Tax=Chironomus riparius TaxID=315576 RepID=A0A9N9WT47_9DIPT|nr:unnamed protein product [Chironomus riparius]
MFTNIILLSLFTIIYGINGESGNQNLREQQNAYNLLDVPTQHEDLRFFKTPRAIRTPFRNTEIMTARGFGKRNDENTQSNYGRENEIEKQDMINDYGMADEKVQRSFLYPYFQDLLKLPKFSDSSVSSAPIKNHRLQLRDGTLKFRLNDGNLRIGRGFGKRSFFVDSLADDRNSYNTAGLLKEISQLNYKENKEET